MTRTLRRAALPALGLALACSLPGCGTAAIYHHVVTPLDLNANGLDLGQLHKSHSTVRVDPTSYISVEWGNRGIGEIARDHDFVTVDHADLEVLAIMGVYTQRFVHIYGVRRQPSEALSTSSTVSKTSTSSAKDSSSSGRNVSVRFSSDPPM